LTENPFEGGGGYTMQEVGQMTLDQIWSRLCEIDLLKSPVGSRIRKMSSDAAIASLRPDAQGFYKGRAADGTPLRGRIRGKSLCRELMEKEEERKAEAKRKEEKKKRRRRRRPA
jgi:hypothetical protein